MVLPYATAQDSIELLTTVLLETLIQTTLIYAVVTFFGIIFSSKECIIPSVLCALLFAIGHLPMVYKIVVDPNTYDIVRALLLNGFAGITFGLLYWIYGLVASMLSHFIADLVIHVFWIL